MNTLEKIRLKSLNEMGDAYNKITNGIMKKTGESNYEVGGYAKVYPHPEFPKTRVIKIARTDYAYENYVKFVIKHPNNSYLPKIYSTKIYYYDNRNMIVVEMEKLFHFKMENEYEDWSRANIDCMQYTKYFRQADEKSFPENISAFQSRRHMKIALMQVHRGLRKLMKFHCLDLHNENLMYRANGQVVFTDPLAWNRPDYSMDGC